MKKITNESHIVLGGKTLELPTSKGKDGFFIPILSKIDDQLSAMLSHHCKILVIRIDLRLSNQSNDNQVMTEFMRRYKKRITRKYKLDRLGYVWCREQNRANQHHYHLALMVDGNKARQGKPFTDIAKEYWDNLDMGSAWVPTRSYIMLKRGDDLAYREQFERLSYLAKVYSKSPSKRSASANDYEGSRIKHKEAA